MSHAIGRALLSACLLAGIAGAAHAHATLQESEAPANSTYRAVLTIPHGCDGQATHTVRVELPEGFIAVKPMLKPGWTITVETGAYGQTYDYYGTPMAEGPRAIVWSGGNLPDDFFDEFVFRGRIVDMETGTTLAFETTQTCDQGEVAWVELPAAGQSAHDLAHPAPTLTIIESHGDDGHGHGGHGDGTVTLGDLSIGTLFSRATVGRSGAAYLVIENGGYTADRLVAASSAVAQKVELHEMTVEDDIMRMAEVDGGIEVPAHGSVTLAPGGLHVMLMGLGGPLEEGGSFELTLSFEHAGEVTVTVPVLAAGADGAAEHDHSAH